MVLANVDYTYNISEELSGSQGNNSVYYVWGNTVGDSTITGSLTYFSNGYWFHSSCGLGTKGQWSVNASYPSHASDCDDWIGIYWIYPSHQNMTFNFTAYWDDDTSNPDGDGIRIYLAKKNDLTGQTILKSWLGLETDGNISGLGNYTLQYNDKVFLMMDKLTNAYYDGGYLDDIHLSGSVDDPTIESYSASDVVVTTSSTVTYSVTSYPSTSYNSSSCIVELYKSDYGSPLHNYTTTSISTNTLSVDVPMSNYTTGVLEWRGVYCYDENGGNVASASPNINVTISSSGGGTSPPSSGSSGSTTIIVNQGTNNSFFSFISDRGGSDNNVLFYPGQERRFGLIINSLYDEAQEIQLSCAGAYCGHVHLSTDSVRINPNEQKVFYVDVVVDDDADYGDEFDFKVSAHNNVNFVQEVGYKVSVSKVASFFSKFDLLTEEGDPGFLFRIGGLPIPRILFYFVVTGLFLAGFLGLYSKRSGKAFWSVLSSMILFVVLVVIV